MPCAARHVKTAGERVYHDVVKTLITFLKQNTRLYKILRTPVALMVWETWLEITFFTAQPFGLFELKNISKFMVGSGTTLTLPESSHPSSHEIFKEAVGKGGDSGKRQMKYLFYY